MKQRNLTRLMSPLAVCAVLAGCVPDTSYDFKNIDTEVTVLKGVEVPLPNIQEILLKDLLKEAATGDVFTTDPVTGDYLVSLSMDKTGIDGFTVDASGFTLNVNSGSNLSVALGNYSSIPANTPLSYSPETEQAKTALANYGNDFSLYNDLRSGMSYVTSIPLSLVVADFPTEVKSFQKCSLNGNLIFSLSNGLPFNQVYLKAGTEISFPGFLQLSACNNNKFSLAGNKLTALEDINLGTGALSIELVLSGIDMGTDGIATNGSLNLSGQIDLNATVSLNPASFTGPKASKSYGSYSISYVSAETALGHVSYQYTASNVALSSATIKVNPDSVVPTIDQDYEINIEGLPDMLTGDGVNFELSELLLILDLDNQMPFAFKLGAQLKAQQGESITHSYSISNLLFPANTQTVYSIGEDADGVVPGGTYVNLPDLGKILSPVPDKVVAGNFQISLEGTDQWITVNSGDSFGGSLTAGIRAPLAFSANSHISLGVDMDNVSLEIGEQIPHVKAKLCLTASNTIPLSFDLAVKAKDADGNFLTGVTSTVNKPIAPGKPGAPGVTDIEILLQITENQSIKGLRLDLTAASAQSVAGTPLNENQGLTLSNISLSLPEGITADLNSLTTGTKQ